MSWVLLLIELIPTVIKIINAIMDLIRQLPRGERPAARRELHATARRHVESLREQKHRVQVEFAVGDAQHDLAAMLARLEQQVGAA